MQLTHCPFSVNVRADIDQRSHIEAALQNGASVIHLFFWGPAPYTAVLHNAGAKMMVTVTSTDEVKKALDAGTDIFIAQGWEAGDTFVETDRENPLAKSRSMSPYAAFATSRTRDACWVVMYLLPLDSIGANMWGSLTTARYGGK